MCEGNSNQINNGKTNDLSDAPKNDTGSEYIINTKECPDRIIAHYNFVEKSCNVNTCMRQNKQPINSEINHCKKRKQEKAAFMRQYRPAKASPEKRAKHNEYQRNYRKSNASRQKKATLNEYQRNDRASNASLQFLVTKFHDIVSQGPVYACTCCDQLCYKHSVLHADKLRHSNPEIDKYPCNIRKVLIT